MSPTHHRSHSSGQGAAKGSGTLALGSASPMPGAGLRRCGGHPKGEQGGVSPSPCKLHWSPQNGKGETHQGIPAGTARLIRTASACHLESAIAMELQRGRGAPQVRSPG